MPRDSDPRSRRIVQTSLQLAQSWRANCDFQFLYYESDPSDPDANDIAKVIDYIVSYVCKGIETLQEEREHNKDLVLVAKEKTSCPKDVKRLARQILDRSLGEKLISKQECMVQLADLKLFICSESFEHVSLGR